MPVVSYVVTTYNKSPYIDDLIYSLSQQMEARKAELIVVDDHSTDDTIDSVRRATSRYLSSFTRIRLFAASFNAGPSAAINHGIGVSTGRFLHFVDGDDRVPRGATLAMVAAAEGGADLVYGGKVGLDGPLKLFQASAHSVHAAALERLVERKIVGMRFLAARDVVLATGGADESVFIQDVSLPLRIACGARALAEFSVPVVEVRVAASSISQNKIQELHDFCRAVHNLLVERDVDSRSRTVLLRRVWQRLMNCRRLSSGARVSAFGYFALAASGRYRPTLVFKIGEFCEQLAQVADVRRPHDIPVYAQIM